MTTPNIVAVTSINGKSVVSRPANTSLFSIVSNPLNSGHVYKINNIVCSNQNGSSPVSANVFYNDQESGLGTNSALVYQASVPALTTLIIVDKSTSFYLEENRSIVVSSGTSNGISFSVSYEDIS